MNFGNQNFKLSLNMGKPITFIPLLFCQVMACQVEGLTYTHFANSEVACKYSGLSSFLAEGGADISHAKLC